MTTTGFKFLPWIAATALVCSCSSGGSAPGSPDPLGGAAAPWKVDVVLHDHPMAGSVAVGDAVLLEDDTLIVPVSVAWRADFVGHDWFETEDALRLYLVSRGRGLSWQAHEPGVWKSHREAAAPVGAYQGASSSGHLQDLVGYDLAKSFELRDGTRLRLRWLGYRHHFPCPSWRSGKRPAIGFI